MKRTRRVLWLSLAVVALIGCQTAPTSQPVVEQPSEFFTLCTRDLVSATFPEALSSPQDGDDTTTDNALPHDKAEAEHIRTFRSTVKDASEHMQKLHARLREEATAQKCQLGEGVASSSKEVPGLIDGFTFTYTADDHQGTVKGQIEVRQPPDKDKKMLYTVILTVTETMKPQ